MQFLIKLGEHLATARGNLLMMQPLPTISHAYRMLAQEERQREIVHLYSMRGMHLQQIEGGTMISRIGHNHHMEGNIISSILHMEEVD